MAQYPRTTGQSTLLTWQRGTRNRGLRAATLLLGGGLLLGIVGCGGGDVQQQPSAGDTPAEVEVDGTEMTVQRGGPPANTNAANPNVPAAEPKTFSLFDPSTWDQPAAEPEPSGPTMPANPYAQPPWAAYAEPKKFDLFDPSTWGGEKPDANQQTYQSYQQRGLGGAPLPPAPAGWHEWRLNPNRRPAASPDDQRPRTRTRVNLGVW